MSWHHKRNCYKHGCVCIVTTKADGIAGVPNGKEVKVHDDSKCECGRPSKRLHMPIPDDYPVRPLTLDENPKGRTTCLTCGLSWDDSVSTSITPTPSGRCPFEHFHINRQ